jgi:asparagine synthase (glutamine-hydrolysing)
MIALARRSGETLRRTNSITKSEGVGWHAPFLDDRVVEAALSVRLVDRSDMNAYKPVLAAAMRNHVPREILGRPTKSDFSADVFSGFHANKRKMLSWCDDLRLADVGLVDATALKSVITQPHAGPRGLTQISVTLAAEAWLRAIETNPGDAPKQRRWEQPCCD